MKYLLSNDKKRFRMYIEPEKSLWVLFWPDYWGSFSGKSLDDYVQSSLKNEIRAFRPDKTWHYMTVSEY